MRIGQTAVVQPTSVKHTSEEHGVPSGVTFGRGHLVLDVAEDGFGDLI